MSGTTEMLCWLLLTVLLVLLLPRLGLSQEWHVVSSQPQLMVATVNNSPFEWEISNTFIWIFFVIFTMCQAQCYLLTTSYNLIKSEEWCSNNN